MKKSLGVILGLLFLNMFGSAQPVEWVTTISGLGSLKYVNDSLIYLIDFENTGRIGNSNLTGKRYAKILNHHGKIIQSKVLDNSFRYFNYSLNFMNTAQKFILDNDRVMFSNEGLILDKNLIDQRLGSAGVGRYFSDFTTLSVAPDISAEIYKFWFSDSKNNTYKENYIKRDRNFYTSNCVYGHPFIDSKKTLWFSRCTQSNSNTTRLPSNTVGSNIITYTSRRQAERQTIMNYDTSNALRLLPSYDGMDVPMYFQEDSRGFIYNLSWSGTLVKYTRNPWDSVWTKWVGNTGHYGLLYIDKNDQIYTANNMNGDANSLVTLDTSGKILFKKEFSGAGVWDIDSDNANSIYVALDTNLTPNSGAKRYRQLDCYTVSGFYVAKLYTGTLPSTPLLSRSGLVLRSNFPRGVTWYRNDSLLSDENNTSLLALRDGKYMFKSFCKQDTITFKGIRDNNGTLETISIPGATYQWTVNDVPIPNATTYQFKQTNPGLVKVYITFNPAFASFATGRTQSSQQSQAIYRYDQVQLSIDDAENSEESSYFSVYPNPANETISIKSIGYSNQPQVQFINTLAKVVFAISLTSELQTLDVSHLPKGMYTVKVGNQTRKLILE